MKRLICFIIILVSLFLVSCASNAPIVNSTPTAEMVSTVGTVTLSVTGESSGTSEAVGTTATTITTDKTIPAEAYVKTGYSHYAFSSIETRSKVFIDCYPSGVYYSKADGEFYRFCFDPFCTHSTYGENYSPSGCVAGMMGEGENNKPVFINTRVYFVFSGNIYSCSEFATDLRIECKFGETRQIKLSNGVTIIQSPKIDQFKSDEDKLFFKQVSEEGTVVQYMYDTKSRKLVNLDEKIEKLAADSGVNLVLYDFKNGKVYFEAYKNYKNTNDTGKFVGYFSTDDDFSSLVPVEKIFKNFGIFETDIGNISLTNDESENKTQLINSKFNGDTEILIDDVKSTLGGTRWLLYINSEHLFFNRNEHILLGYTKQPYLTGSGLQDQKTDFYNYDGGRIYRFDFKTNEIKCVFDNTDFQNFKIQYIDEENGVAIFVADKFKKVSTDGEYQFEKQGIFKFRIDQEGVFVDMEEVKIE